MSERFEAAELNDLANDLPRFLHSLYHLAQRLGLDLAALEVDHIALRCNQNTTAERWKAGPFTSGYAVFREADCGQANCIIRINATVTGGAVADKHH